jgi:hypothetical protein
VTKTLNIKRKREVSLEALPWRDGQGKVGALGGDEDLGSGDAGGLDALSDLSLVLQGVDRSGSDLSPLGKEGKEKAHLVSPGAVDVAGPVRTGLEREGRQDVSEGSPTGVWRDTHR